MRCNYCWEIVQFFTPICLTQKTIFRQKKLFTPIFVLKIFWRKKIWHKKWAPKNRLLPISCVTVFLFLCLPQTTFSLASGKSDSFKCSGKSFNETLTGRWHLFPFNPWEHRRYPNDDAKREFKICKWQNEVFSITKRKMCEQNIFCQKTLRQKLSKESPNFSVKNRGFLSRNRLSKISFHQKIDTIFRQKKTCQIRNSCKKLTSFFSSKCLVPFSKGSFVTKIWSKIFEK